MLFKGRRGSRGGSVCVCGGVGGGGGERGGEEEGERLTTHAGNYII